MKSPIKVDLTKAATVLVQKIAAAIGSWHKPTGIVREARANAQAQIINAETEVKVNEIQQRGIARFTEQQYRNQANIEKITGLAIQSLNEDAKPEEMDEDWIAHFFSKCEIVSDEQMQILWGRILAGEANKPRTFTKRTLDIVSAMDKADAELFTRICQFTFISCGRSVLFFDNLNNSIYKAKIGVDDIVNLQAMGILVYQGNLTGAEWNQSRVQIFYFDRAIECVLKKPYKIKAGRIIFTQSGEQLARICRAIPNAEFYRHLIEQLESQGIVVVKS